MFDLNMISNRFWEIIKECNKDRDKLEKILLEENKEDICKFAEEFDILSIALTDDEFLNHMQKELSEDNIEDICNWIVSQGKEFYTNIYNHPELIPKYEDIKFKEILAGIAGIVYEDKFDEELP
jgi:Zn-dependent oligopeptidase